MKNQTNSTQLSDLNEQNKKDANEMISEKEKFMRIMQTHHNYLVELRQQNSAKLLREHRARIVAMTDSQLRASFLDGHLNKTEYNNLVNVLRDLLSWFSITGVVVNSIFEDYPLNDESDE